MIPQISFESPPLGLTTLTGGLARGLSTTGALGRLNVLAGHLHTMVRREPQPGVVPDLRGPRVERDLQTGRSVQGTT